MKHAERHHHCITPSDLRALANALDRVRAWHEKLGGRGVGDPCLRSVQVSPRAGRITAHVELAEGGEMTFELAGGKWELRT